jgi:hypothetical protein
VIQETAHAALGEWESFYIIVGSSAAALTGLQFVVITLIGEQRGTASNGAIGAFATPTIVHFCAALFFSVVMSAPWPRLSEPAFVIAASGVVGLIYTATVSWRATRQTAYRMVAEDWIWHVTLPVVVYATLLVAGVLLSRYTVVALFATASASLLLVYIGIHNAWDTSTYMVAQRLEREKENETQAVEPPASATSPGREHAAPADEPR